MEHAFQPARPFPSALAAVDFWSNEECNCGRPYDIRWCASERNYGALMISCPEKDQQKKCFGVWEIIHAAELTADNKPTACLCGDPPKVRETTAGSNMGRLYYGCAKEIGRRCAFFLWVEPNSGSHAVIAGSKRRGSTSYGPRQQSKVVNQFADPSSMGFCASQDVPRAAGKPSPQDAMTKFSDDRGSLLYEFKGRVARSYMPLSTVTLTSKVKGSAHEEWTKKILAALEGDAGNVERTVMRVYMRMQDALKLSDEDVDPDREALVSDFRRSLGGDKVASCRVVDVTVPAVEFSTKGQLKEVFDALPNGAKIAELRILSGKGFQITLSAPLDAYHMLQQSKMTVVKMPYEMLFLEVQTIEAFLSLLPFPLSSGCTVKLVSRGVSIHFDADSAEKFVVLLSMCHDSK